MFNRETMSASLRYGIIGCGVIGSVHANAINQLPNAQLLGVCDIVVDRADEKEPGVGKTCYGNSHQRALAAFTEAVLSNTPYPVNGHTARQAVTVVLGIYASARSGQPMHLTLQ